MLKGSAFILLYFIIVLPKIILDLWDTTPYRFSSSLEYSSAINKAENILKLTHLKNIVHEQNGYKS